MAYKRGVEWNLWFKEKNVDNNATIFYRDLSHPQENMNSSETSTTRTMSFITIIGFSSEKKTTG